ncbi:hypothetical protein TNCV_2922391 [Trichonephila clavipes]|nr:hypothetical protein TNCV_2922391 [Trichonephila clavipes]
MDRLKFKLEIFGLSSASPPTNKTILTDDEENNVVEFHSQKDRKRYNPPDNTCHGFYPGYSRIKGLTCIAIFDDLMVFQGFASADLKATKAVRKHMKNAMVIYTWYKQIKILLQ